MKILFGALLLLFMATSLALLAVYNPGYVMIVREPLVFETSLAVFLLLLLVLFACFYALARLGTRIIKAPAALERWRQTRRTRKSRESFQDGLLQAVGGEWLKAEQSLLASLHGADRPQLAWLALAVVAHRQQNHEKRDNYLGRAQQSATGHNLTVRLLQAELQTLSFQHEAALATLVDLHSTHPQHLEVARCLLATYRELNDWGGLAHLLKELEHHNRLSAAERRPYELVMYRALLNLRLPAGARATLDQAWNALPENFKQEPSLITIYARQLQHQQAMDASTAILADALDRNWNDELAHLYGEAEATQPPAQLERALEWLPAHTENPVLLTALARIARRAGQLERAQAWLGQALAHGGGHDTEAELGRLAEARGNKEQALTHYRRALESTDH
jgi:HemY protein